jgi:ubiquinone/menaquinone biosynthesis C-methylase UbiE
VIGKKGKILRCRVVEDVDRYGQDPFPGKSAFGAAHNPIKMMKFACFLSSFTATCAFFVTPDYRHLRINLFQHIPQRVDVTRRNAENPRVGAGQWLLDQALNSPVWKLVLVPQARQKIINTAEENGIAWNECKNWLTSQSGPWQNDEILDVSDIPDYYKKEFHAYENGNLCWDAALEVEIASAAVGARNFPACGRDGEQAFRDSFGVALQEMGATCPAGGTIVDLGCGSGMSTRWLAARYPHAGRLLGIDLSPYFVQVGKRLLELQPNAKQAGGEWVSSVAFDGRIKYQTGDATNTQLPNESVDVATLQFVAHELPYEITLEIIRETHRILKPNGQLWFCEMDFESPAYAAQRANPLLFSLIRSTEPYLDDYADHSVEIRECLQATFGDTKIAAATGRHFSIVATKLGASKMGVLEDLRFDEYGSYKVEDTHLKVFENKKK